MFYTQFLFRCFLCPTIICIYIWRRNVVKNVLPTIYLFLCSLGVKLYLFSLLENNVFSFHLIYRSRTAHQIFCFISFWKVLIYVYDIVVEDIYIVSINAIYARILVQSLAIKYIWCAPYLVDSTFPVLCNTARISSLFKSHIKMQQKNVYELRKRLCQ